MTYALVLEIPGVVAALIAIATGLLVLAGFIAGPGRVAQLRAGMNDLRALNKDKDDRITDLEQSMARVEAELAAQRSVNRELASTLTGADRLAGIATAQVEYAKLSTDRHAEIMLALARLVPGGS